jgi:hypothetical protein
LLEGDDKLRGRKGYKTEGKNVARQRAIADRWLSASLLIVEAVVARGAVGSVVLLKGVDVIERKRRRP